MKTIKQKWQPVLEYKKIPEERWEECSGKLEKFEQSYKDEPEQFKIVMSEYLRSIVDGTEKTFGGGIKELCQEMSEQCQKLSDISSRRHQRKQELMNLSQEDLVNMVMEWEEQLSSVMPVDFKDWWQNDKKE